MALDTARRRVEVGRSQCKVYHGAIHPFRSDGHNDQHGNPECLYRCGKVFKGDSTSIFRGKKRTYSTSLNETWCVERHGVLKKRSRTRGNLVGGVR